MPMDAKDRSTVVVAATGQAADCARAKRHGIRKGSPWNLRFR
jgi:hypothetical protein